MQNSSPRQAFFESFSRLAVETVEREYHTSAPGKKPPLIMLTGGLRTRSQFSRALERRHAHLLGLGRLSVLQPALPRLLQEFHEQVKSEKSDDGTHSRSVEEQLRSWETRPSPEPSSPSWWPHLVGAGVGMAWYVVAMRRLALSRGLPYGAHWLQLISEMHFRGSYTWRKWVSLSVILSLISVFFASLR